MGMTDDEEDERVEVQAIADVGGYWADMKLLTQTTTQLLVNSPMSEVTPERLDLVVDLAVKIMSACRKRISAEIDKEAAAEEHEREPVEPS